MMHCPRDGVLLRRTLLARGAIAWTCSGCRGRALTMPVLRRQFTEPAALELWRRTLAASSDAVGAACPSCMRAMASIGVPHGDSFVELDACRACQLVWFDPDEHERLPRRPQPSAVPDDGLTTEARQELAIAEVQEMARQARLQEEEEPSLTPSRLPALFGMPVELHGSPLAGRPWGTWTLAAVVTATSILGFHDPEFRAAWQLVPAAVTDSYWLTAWSAFFLHGSWWHLIGNLWFLLVFGDDVENRFGRARWLALVGGATFLGSAAQVLFDPRADVPCVGASGGISGLIVSYALLFPATRLGVFLSLGRWQWRPMWVTFSAAGGLLWWLGLQLVLLWQQLAGVGYVAAVAHLGGALAGLLAWLAWRDRGSC